MVDQAEPKKSIIGTNCCQEPICPEPCDRARRPSVRHCVNLCIEDGGFSAVIRCVNPAEISADIYRAGATKASELDFNLSPVKNKGNTFYFALPQGFWSYPVGYYDADLYYGDQYTKTIRLNLHPTASTPKVSAEASQSDCYDKPAPNIEKVVECCEVCGCNCCECCDNNECPERKDLCDTNYHIDPLDDLKEYINDARVMSWCEMTDWLSTLTEKVEGVDLPEACFETESILTILKDIDNLDEELSDLLEENIDK